MRLLSCAAALIGTAAVGLTAGSLCVAQATTGPHGWRIVEIIGPPGGTSNTYDVAATGSGDAWATGILQAAHAAPRLAVEHWNGHRWQPLAAPQRLGSGQVVTPLVGASSAANVWVFPYIISNASHSDALRWQGARWMVTRFPPGSRILAAAVFGRSDVWALGEIRQLAAPFSTRPYAVRFTGRRWRQVRVPVLPDFVAALSPAAIWAVGPTAQSANSPQPIYALAHWDGRKWHTVRLHWAAGAVPEGITALGPRNVWFDDDRYSNGALVGADMNIWTPGLVGSAFGEKGVSFGDLTADGKAGVWLAAYSPFSDLYYIEHVHDSSGNTTFQAVPAKAGHTTILARLTLIPRTRSVWAVGTLYAHGYATSQGVILKYGT